MVTDILQPTHLIFILVVALLVLGPKRLPEVGRSLGRGMRDFRSALSGDEPERHEEVTPVAPTTTAAAAPPVEPLSESEPLAESDALAGPDPNPELEADPTREQHPVG